jgi:hypothetical protein
MGVRGELYDLLGMLPGGNPALRILATGAYLDELPEVQAEFAARRMLALAKAMASEVAKRPSAAMDEVLEVAAGFEGDMMS